MNFKDIWLIAFRELKGYVKQKSALILILIVPFVGLYGYVQLLGMMNDTSSDDDKGTTAYSVGAPAFMEDALKELNIEPINASEADEKRKDIENAKADLLIVFPEDFTIAADILEAPSNVEIWYNSSEISSINMFSKTNAMLSMYQPVAFTVNLSEDVKYDLGDEDSQMKDIVSMIMPMMLCMMITLAVMNISAESIAGDKERGFLNTVLAAPISPLSIAMGKMLAVCVAGLIAGISAFGGMLVSIPKLAGFASDGDKVISYGTQEYILLFLVTLACVFVTISIMLLVSALSNTVKQATTVSPFIMILAMLCSLLTSNKAFAEKIEELGTANYCIPVWNAVTNMQEILKVDYSVSNIIVTCVSSIVFCIILAVVIGKCFKSEKILNG